MTTFLIGVDEAGYGPNLGPLVVAASVWQVEEVDREAGETRGGWPAKARELGRLDLYKVLADRISLAADEERLAIADSKTLYTPAAGLRLLEEGVLAALSCCDMAAASWLSLVELLGADPEGNGRTLPWHASWDLPLPFVACAERIGMLTQRLLSKPSAKRTRSVHPHGRVALRDVQACLVQPADFNRLTSESGTKATALSRITLSLVRRVLERVRNTSNGNGRLNALAICDKHGGRNYYASLLAEAFSQPLVHVEEESRAASRYALALDGVDAVVTFKREGETFLPTALASMTAKYVRELSMRAFNEYWCERVADLRPTAGYPGDSRRFKTAIAPLQLELGIDDHVLWRSR